MIDEICIANNYTFSDTYFAGIVFGGIFFGPLVHCLFSIGDIFLECLLRYRAENTPRKETLKAIFKKLKDF